MKEEKIKEIRHIIGKYGSFSVEEMNHDALVLAVINDTSQLITDFYYMDVKTEEYVKEFLVNTEFIRYEDLPENIVNKIYELVKNYEVDKKNEI